jgi:hypothetical protein
LGFHYGLVGILESLLQQIALIHELLLDRRLVGGDLLNFHREKLGIKIHGSQSMSETIAVEVG